MSKKSGRIVGSRYLQSYVVSASKKSLETHSSSVPRKQLSEVNINTQHCSNTLQPSSLSKSRPEVQGTQNQSVGRMSGKGKSSLNSIDLETERLAWVYLNQQTLLSLQDYRKEQDKILINLSGQVVLLHEQLYEKESLVENDATLERDVENLKNAQSSISRINASLNTRFLDLYDDYTAEIGIRINQIELDNSFVNSQGELEAVLKEINNCLSSVSSNLEMEMESCKVNLDQIYDECIKLQPKVAENLKLLHQANRMKIKNMALLNTKASIR